MATQARLELRYGTNPHQSPAAVLAVGEKLPFRVLNGAPSAINILDAMLAWNLVRELREALGLPAAASYKHLSPAGAGLGVPLPDDLKESYFVGELELSPVANAYARARGADRLCSFGDCVADQRRGRRGDRGAARAGGLRRRDRARLRAGGAGAPEE